MRIHAYKTTPGGFALVAITRAGVAKFQVYLVGSKYPTQLITRDHFKLINAMDEFDKYATLTRRAMD